MMTETVVNVQEAPNNNAANKPQGSAESPLSWIKINVDYFKTTPGLLKIAQFILGILCMALASPAFAGGVHFFLFVATTSFIFTLIWIFIYFLGVREGLALPINWILTELLNTGLWAVLYIIASIILIIVSTTHPLLLYVPESYFRPYIAAGALGLLNGAVYCFATYLINIQWKSSRTMN